MPRTVPGSGVAQPCVEALGGSITTELPTVNRAAEDGKLTLGKSRYGRVEAAALSLFTRYAPKGASQMAAYLAVLVSLLTVLAIHGSDPAPPTPPPAPVIVVELPPHCRPTGPPLPSHTFDLPQSPTRQSP